jgi:DNA-binding PadR family transcriptional regulator
MLTDASGAVLGMVALGARSGYEIKRAGEQSLRFFWALGPPQIYAELGRLEADRLIKGTDKARGQRKRRSYTVTAAGRKALREWLAAPDAAALEIRDGELLKLFFADALAPAELVARLASMRERSERAIARFEREILPAAERVREQGYEWPHAVAEFGSELHEFIAGWCERFERQARRAA